MTEQILAVQRMQDYIEQHLSENITLAKLSEVSLYSPWYSYRLFKEHTNAGSWMWRWTWGLEVWMVISGLFSGNSAAIPESTRQAPGLCFCSSPMV